MMKVIIADDEIQVRRGLKMKADWEEEGFQIAGEASNGKEALQLVEETRADLVITDVRMPVMDGIEFAGRCHREYPHVKVIVLSGYSDFDYVRSSLIEGVKDYLLKPVAPNELAEALRRVKNEIVLEKKKQFESEKVSRLVHTQLEGMKEQYVLQLVKEEWSEPFAAERLQHLNLGFLAEEEKHVQFFTVELRASAEHSVKELWLPFRMLCKEMADQYEGTCTFYDAGYANMLHFLHCKDKKAPLETSSMVKKVQTYVRKYLQAETVIGVGKPASVTELKTGYISSLLAWSQSDPCAKSQIIDGTLHKEVFELSPDQEKKAANMIENGSLQECSKLIFDLLNEAKIKSMLSFSFAANRLLLMLESLAAKYDMDRAEMNQTMWTCQQSIGELTAHEKVIEQVTSFAHRIILLVRKSRSSPNGLAIVENVRRYLDLNFANEVTLTSLAEQFHINSAYLSELFKLHIGQNFSDYLVEVRMKHACELLRDRQLKVIDIAFLTGYSNSGYFSTVFKKHVGQTPAEYRKSALNLDEMAGRER
ncbi:response regulator transcription factor [Metabacillus idriensis]|uniref:response regulator transcription factor n=1 Tax=Metabacillus idriensis TaxID=324768 RepID=UPI001CD37DA7|nr:response regulator transcription factor [Metabacillus idriensis]